MAQFLHQKSYSHNDRMRDIVDDNPHLLPALSRFGIPLGFGDSTVNDVCINNNVHTSTFLAVANVISGYPHNGLKVDIEALNTYLKNAHDYFLGYVLPNIRKKLIEAISSSSSAELPLVMIRFFDEYMDEMRANIQHENDEIINSRHNPSDPEFHKALDKFQTHHHTMSDKLREIKELLICHFHTERERVDLLNALLFEIMTFERDMLAHCQVEDSLFVPAVLGINLSSKNIESGYEEDGFNNTSLDSNGDIRLTPRECDIVRAIARGLSNKEIAENLFLSVHTVTTHRRNISSKLGIHSASGMTLYAILHGLISLEEGEKIVSSI